MLGDDPHDGDHWSDDDILQNRPLSKRTRGYLNIGGSGEGHD